MRNFILVFVSVFLGSAAFAQKIKTGVVVFGATPAGLAAAIQSAHSGVKTVLVDKGSIDMVDFAAVDKAYKTGVYAQFLDRVDSIQKKSSVKNNHSLVPSYVGSVFKGWTDTIKNLTVLKRLTIKKIEQDGKNWEITLNDRREIKCDVVVDATPENEVASQAKVSASTVRPSATVYSDKLYRTSLALGNYSLASFVPALSLIADKAENFFLIPKEVSSMLVGQGAGAAASYCSFFNTTTKKLDVRKTQAELILFNSRFLKFDDLSMLDSNVVSIHKIALTGVLKGKIQGDKFLFLPDSTVSTEEIRLPLREYFSRSQIWFLDHKSQKLTLEETLSLIKFTAGRGNELDKEIERAWNTSFKFRGKFDLKAVLTRYQVAVLFDRYLKPFERGVDLNGNLRI